jgi:hypothetical protein
VGYLKDSKGKGTVGFYGALVPILLLRSYFVRVLLTSELYLAIVNRAVLDVLENGENSAAAERWLLGRDFDRLQELFD